MRKNIYDRCVKMEYDPEKEREKNKKQTIQCCANCNWGVQGLDLYYCENSSAVADNGSDAHKMYFTCKKWCHK